jgi:hypothetical protein
MEDVEPGTEPMPYQTIETVTIVRHKRCDKPLFIPERQKQ